MSRTIARTPPVTVSRGSLMRSVARPLLLGSLIASSMLALPLLSVAHSATLPFQVVSQSATYSPRSGDVTFRIVFNRAPDFSATDSFGRQADSFQYFIVGNPSLPYPSNYDSIIRGEEIHATPDLIPIRNVYPPDYGDPTSGGWGTIRGEVPYTLDGATLTFAARVSMISSHTGLGSISYRLETYTYGGLSGVVIDSQIVVLASKDQCKNGGWRNFPQFRNQGGCVSFVETGGRTRRLVRRVAPSPTICCEAHSGSGRLRRVLD